MKRYCIYPKEIALILGKSNSYSCTMVRNIRAAYQIKNRRPISIKEFCNYNDLPFDDVYNIINPSKE